MFQPFCPSCYPYHSSSFPNHSCHFKTSVQVLNRCKALLTACSIITSLSPKSQWGFQTIHGFHTHLLLSILSWTTLTNPILISQHTLMSNAKHSSSHIKKYPQLLANSIEDQTEDINNLLNVSFLQITLPNLCFHKIQIYCDQLTEN